MELSELLVRVLFLFLPGIIATIVIEMLTSHRKRQAMHFIIHSYLLGVMSYGLLLFIVFINNKIVIIRGEVPTWEVTFLKTLFNDKENIHVNEVFWASLIGLLVAILITAMINYSLIYWLTNKLKISRKHGEGDVWDFMFNSSDTNWVNIRYNDFVYQGSVVSYSEKENTREVLLNKVKVYPKDGGNELYEMPYMYFNFDVNSNIIIEVMS